MRLECAATFKDSTLVKNFETSEFHMEVQFLKFCKILWPSPQLHLTSKTLVLHTVCDTETFTQKGATHNQDKTVSKPLRTPFSLYPYCMLQFPATRSVPVHCDEISYSVQLKWHVISKKNPLLDYQFHYQ